MKAIIISGSSELLIILSTNKYETNVQINNQNKFSIIVKIHIKTVEFKTNVSGF